MSPDTLRQIMPFAGARADTYAEPLTNAMIEFMIDSPKRQAAFLAQIAHESGSLRYVKELASGTDYDTGQKAADLGNTPEADGDGQRYKGRGLIQITGKANYRNCGKALGLDLLTQPELLEQAAPACRSAGWFWKSRNLNDLADKDQFCALTRKINGGFNGLDDRIKHWLLARRVLGL